MKDLLEAAALLRDTADSLHFDAKPLVAVYNPLSYAWPMHEAYVNRYGKCPKKAVFLGMNPGPHGMVQTGVPFGDPTMVREFLQLNEPIQQPKNAHPLLPVSGLQHRRGEVSGRRLWSLFKKKFGCADAFFKDYFVLNYCPLAFFAEGKRGPVNYTPDKLHAAQTRALYAACDAHLRAVVQATQAQWVVGVGGFAEKRARETLEGLPVKITAILHPSPASPLANRGDWGETVSEQLCKAGVWTA